MITKCAEQNLKKRKKIKKIKKVINQVINDIQIVKNSKKNEAGSGS